MDTQTQSLNLEKAGITKYSELHYNVSYDDLFTHETNPELEGYEKATETSLGCVTIDTGKFTGRSPKDKYIVRFIRK